MGDDNEFDLESGLGGILRSHFRLLGCWIYRVSADQYER